MSEAMRIRSLFTEHGVELEQGFENKMMMPIITNGKNHTKKSILINLCKYRINSFCPYKKGIDWRVILPKVNLEREWKECPKWFLEGFLLKYSEEEERFVWSGAAGEMELHMLHDFSGEENQFFENQANKMFGDEYALRRVFEKEKTEREFKAMLYVLNNRLENQLNSSPEMVAFNEKIEDLIENLLKKNEMMPT